MQSLSDIEIPVNFRIKLNQGQQEPAGYVFTRFKNITVMHDHHMICCGRIGTHNPVCYKAQKKQRVAPSEVIPISSVIEDARNEYVNNVMEAIVERANNMKFAGITGLGAPKMYLFRMKTCKAWNSFTNTINGKNTGLCEPGQVCYRTCKMFPCVAIRAGAAEELVQRTVYNEKLANM